MRSQIHPWLKKLFVHFGSHLRVSLKPMSMFKELEKFRSLVAFVLAITFLGITGKNLWKFHRGETVWATTVIKRIPDWPALTICYIFVVSKYSDLMEEMILSEEIFEQVELEDHVTRKILNLNSSLIPFYVLYPYEEGVIVQSCSTVNVFNTRNTTSDILKLSLWSNRTSMRHQVIHFGDLNKNLGLIEGHFGSRGDQKLNGSLNDRRYEFTFRHRIYMRTPENDCDSEESHNVLTCTDDYIMTNGPCVPKWRLRELKRKPAKTCETMDDLKVLANFYQALIDTNDLNSFLHQTGCKLSCNVVTVNYHENFASPSPHNLTSTLWIMSGQREIKEDQEVFIYDQADFVADLGGFLGLLLGLSALTIYDLMIEAIVRINKLFNIKA